MIGRGQASDDVANREATRNHKTKRILQLQQFATLKANLDKGLAEKVCTFEPHDKPCDHCSMCSSRGF